MENAGTGPLTNVRLTAVQFLDHPASVLTTTLPAPIAATLADCASADGTFSFTLQGATFAQSTRIRVEVTADQLGGQVRSQVVTIGNLETNAQAVATRTYDFDVDLQGWTVLAGTFARQAGGAQGTPFHVTSSENLADQCDVIRSPFFRMKAGSTLSIWNRFQIEPSRPGRRAIRPRERRQCATSRRERVRSWRRAAGSSTRWRRTRPTAPARRPARRAGTAPAPAIRPSTSAAGTRAPSTRAAPSPTVSEASRSATGQTRSCTRTASISTRRRSPTSTSSWRTRRTTAVSRRPRLRRPWPWTPPATACTSPTRRWSWRRRGVTPACRPSPSPARSPTTPGRRGRRTRSRTRRPATAPSPWAAARAAPPPATATRWRTSWPRGPRRTGTPRSWRRSIPRLRRRRGRSTSATASPKSRRRARSTASSRCCCTAA